jgi:predicted nucleic acid-binding protein
MEVLIDTSVWIECNKNAKLKTVIERMASQHEIRSSEIIDEEIEKLMNPYEDTILTESGVTLPSTSWVTLLKKENSFKSEMVNRLTT